MNYSNSIITAPEEYSFLPKDRHELFLAGSIEMGRATDWQNQLIDELGVLRGSGKLRIYNPRRKNWNPEWSQDGEHPELLKQIQWELRALERVDTILFHFEPGTISPISLLEFGLHARSGKSIVSCPKGFWRRANVLTTTNEYGAFHTDSLRVAIKKSIERIIS